jgi:hypothetical protein
MLQDEPFSWQTPGGNPMNALFIVPLVMAHVYFPPSTALLRSVAVASGLAVLAINWLLCRWVFDRRTATISTVMLAILPIDIAYSRFAWDSCQSLAATLPVLYASLAALRFPRQHGHWIVTAILAQIIAVLVHPTNIFAAVAIATAVIARRSLKTDRSETSAQTPPPTSRWRIGDPWQWGMIAVLGACLAVWVFDRLQLPVAGFLTQRFGELRALSRPAAPPDGLVLYARLFTGGTVYRYFAGSRSWMEWPLPDGIEGWGIDVVVFWAVTLAAAWFLWRSWKRSQRNEDGGLIACWILGLAAFLLIAGPRAMVPGGERFALCLIGPAVLLTARGASLAWESATTTWRVPLAVATLGGWLVLADYQQHYFRFIERTGGESQLTFRAAATDPKQAAIEFIMQRTGNHSVWIVCSQYWDFWPIVYFTQTEPRLHVAEAEKPALRDYRKALIEGRVWFVEFEGSEAARQVESRLAGRGIDRQMFPDFSGRPVICAMRPTPLQTIYPIR